MPAPRFRACVFSTVLLVVAASHAFAQGYPNRPIRIVTSQPGGGSDFIARVIAQSLSESLGQRVVVDNRGIIAAEIALQATPDGYTLLLYGSPLWISPLVRNVPWDPTKDFAPITWTVDTPNLLVVNPSVPVRSVQDLIALARTKPGVLNYGSSSTGSTQHLAAELFKVMARVSIVRIPYKGSGPALNAVIAGHVQVMFPSAGSAAPHVRSGRLSALAVTTARPSALAPGLPTVAASGLPGYESSSPFGIFAPARTPTAIVNRLNQEIVNVLHRTELKERLFTAGVEVVASSPKELADMVKSEMTKWGLVIKEAHIRND